METTKFATVNLSNGDYFGQMTKSNIKYLLGENMLKVEMVDGNGENIYVVKSEKDISYLRKFYVIDNDEDDELDF
jgi:hypothetical protein